MAKYLIHSVFYKALSSSESSIDKQYNILLEIIKDIKPIDPLFSQWYINNLDPDDIDLDDIENIKPPLDYVVPSDRAKKYLLNSRKDNPLDSFLLWNGEIDNSLYASVSLSVAKFSFNFGNELKTDSFIKIFEIILKHLRCKYLYISNTFFMKNRVFDHRQPVSPICYVPKALEDKDLPYIYQKIEVNNSLNQGSILVFDQNLFDESEQMKKKIQENSIALVDLDLIPETELSPDFFSEVEF